MSPIRGLSRCARVVVAALLIAVVLTSGCVRRRLTVRSNPVGATVYIDDQQVGTTPASTSFVYYGTRKIQLVKDGYETLTVKQKFSPPWYQIPGVDFVTENLIPYEYRDERIVEFELQPQPVAKAGELMERAEQLRRSTQQGFTVVPPPTKGQPVGTDGRWQEPPMNQPAVPPPFRPDSR